MESYLVVKKLHSDKKDKNYLACFVCFGDYQYMTNLNNEALCMLLDKTPRQLAEIELGYVSPKFKIEVQL